MPNIYPDHHAVGNPVSFNDALCHCQSYRWKSFYLILLSIVNLFLSLKICWRWLRLIWNPPFTAFVYNIRAHPYGGKTGKAVEGMTICCHEQRISVTISIGVVCRPAWENQTLENLLAEADDALYLSKSKGRNQSSLYPCWEAVVWPASKLQDIIRWYLK